MAKKALDADQIKALISTGIDDSESFIGSELSDARQKLLDYYYGNKVGILAAEEGQSQVVDRSVLEAVELFVAQALRMFTGSEFVAFEPEGPEDVEAAQQETDYVNYVVQQQNNGFQLMHDLLKDGALSRMGVAHVQVDKTPKQRVETYSGLTPEQVQSILSEDGTELVNKNERNEMVVADGQPPQPIKVCDVRIKHTSPRVRINVSTIAPEEFGLNRQARSLEDAELVWHKYKASLTELRELGATEEQIAAIQREQSESGELEAQARDGDTSTLKLGEDERTKVWCYRVYLWADFDGDGNSELRLFYYSGKEVLGSGEGEPAEEVPHAAWCPIPMPHRFYGLAVGDLAIDGQEVKTHLRRQGLTNLYMSNEPMVDVPETAGPLAIKDLLSRRAGGIVRTKLAGQIAPIVVPNMLGPTLQMIEYEDQVQENRTGLLRHGVGLDKNALNSRTATEVNRVESQSQLRVELIARLFAENCLVPLYRLVHAFCRRHQDIPQTVMLRNRFVTVNPTEWRERTNLKVSVGLGNGTREQQLSALNQIIAAQAQGLQIGVATPQNLYHSLTKMADLLGFKDAQNFFTQPQPPNPQEQMQKAQQAAQAQAMVEGAKEKAKAEGRAQGEMMKLQANYQQKLMDIEQRERSEQRDLLAERQKLMADYQLRAAELRQKDAHKALDFAANVITHTHDKQVEREAMNRAGQ